MSIQNNIKIRSEEDIVLVRRLAQAGAVEMGFSLLARTRLVTAASELARNIVNFSGSGTVRLETLNNRQGLRLTFEDHGPGIFDIELAMKDGYTTRGGLGLGLAGARRLVDKFEIRSSPGEGTWVQISMWKK